MHLYRCIKNYDGNDYVKLYEVLSLSKNEKLQLYIILFEKYKGMLESPDFDHSYWSKTAEDI